MGTDMTFPTVLLLGSTGSVGEQAVDVIKRHKIKVKGLSAFSNARRVAEQARELRVPAVAMADESAARELKIALADTDTRVYAGPDGIEEMIRESDADTALNAMLGSAGLLPSLAALETGKDLALANKESLVVAGDLVMRAAKEHGRTVTPVDSEHCAVAQALRAGARDEVQSLILTASGGPFFGKKMEDLTSISVDDALAHPTWQMGAKITVDSATLMNKGFEVIEAAHLFDIPVDRIRVVIHRESIIHSMVEYIDNSVIAQMSVPDMRLCVQYALTAPKRAKAVIPPLDLVSLGKLTFAEPDGETFPLLPLAGRAYALGGAVPAALNAANEVAVGAFLSHRIPMLRLIETVTRTVEDMPHAANARKLGEILDIDREARERALAYLA